MSAKKSFAGTPYSRPPSTPRQQIVRQNSSNGSILKTLFTPSKWFGKKTPQKSETVDDEDNAEDQDEEEQSAESETSEEDEEESIVTKFSDRARASLGADSYTAAEIRTPNTSRGTTGTESSSPNAVLATFFQNKGNAPLTSVELEGVKALLAKQSEMGQEFRDDSQIPSYATPMRRPYRPIFTPAKLLAPTQAVTEVKRVRRGYTPSTTAASPFAKRNPARTGFYQPRTPHPAQFSTPSKYELRTTIPTENDTSLEKAKRSLDEVVAPLAKRARPNSQEAEDKGTSLVAATSTGAKTAASMLEILQADTTLNEQSDHKDSDKIKSMLNPYASSSSARKPSSNLRRTPVRKQRRSAIEEIERSDMLEKKLPYQPKKSSGLTNSFSADDDASLFSPRRRVASPANGGTGASTGLPRAMQQTMHSIGNETPTKSHASSDSNPENSSKNMFSTDSSVKTFSTTPKFSFGASQVISKTSFATEIDPGVHSNARNDPQEKSSDAFAVVSEQEPTEHRKFGGFAVKEQPHTSTPRTEDKKEDITSSDSRTALQPSGTATLIDNGSANSVNDDVVVHQLRDGTEYVSPSKSNTKVFDVPAEKPSSNGGFVFKPTHTKSTSSFSFGNFKEANEPVTTNSGFIFDPTKKVGVTPQPTDKPSVVSQSSQTSKTDDSRKRALAVPTDKLQQFAFTLINKSAENDVKKRVLQADLVRYDFSTPTKPVKPVSSGAFDWAAAGIAKPKAGWSCEVCMVNNKDEAKQCAACETEKPDGDDKEAPKENTIAKAQGPSSITGGGFNWAAAGLKVPDQQWSCSTCMTSNPTSANACLACEAER